MGPNELKIHRKNTKSFIDTDAIVIRLLRESKIPTDDGGHKKNANEPPLDPQTFRLIPITDQMPIIQTPDGFQRTPTYVLLGEHDCDMDIWDTFEIDGHTYQIVSPIRPVHSTASVYERKGDVALL
jgi:hypothetical protein